MKIIFLIILFSVSGCATALQVIEDLNPYIKSNTRTDHFEHYTIEKKMEFKRHIRYEKYLEKEKDKTHLKYLDRSEIKKKKPNKPR